MSPHKKPVPWRPRPIEPMRRSPRRRSSRQRPSIAPTTVLGRWLLRLMRLFGLS